MDNAKTPARPYPVMVTVSSAVTVTVVISLTVAVTVTVAEPCVAVATGYTVVVRTSGILAWGLATGVTCGSVELEGNARTMGGMIEDEVVLIDSGAGDEDCGGSGEELGSAATKIELVLVTSRMLV